MTLSRIGLAVACTILPRDHRARYWREFVTQLREVAGWEKACYVVGIVVTAPALRLALRQDVSTQQLLAPDHADRALAAPRTGDRSLTCPPDPDRAPPRLRCAVGLRHEWARFSTPDGERFAACSACGLVVTAVSYTHLTLPTNREV